MCHRESGGAFSPLCVVSFLCGVLCGVRETESCVVRSLHSGAGSVCVCECVCVCVCVCVRVCVVCE